MLEAILNSNPFALLAVGVVIVFVLMFIFVKPDKKKSKSKKAKVEPVKKAEESSQKKEETEKPETAETTAVKKETDEAQETQETSAEELPDKTDEDSADGNVIVTKKKVKKVKSKPEITQVYQRTEKKEVVEEKTEETGVSDELLGKAQFVNTSKKVSRFAGFSTEKSDDAKNDELVSDEFVQYVAEDCEDCKRIVTHFDHSRRLSKIIKDNSFDQMFMEHLTDHYLNMDFSKHLRDIDEKIYEKASEMLSNSDAKVLVETSDSNIPAEQIKNDKEFMRQWLETRKAQERDALLGRVDNSELIDEATEKMIANDVKITAKNLIVGSAIMNRKSLKHNKK